jgi:hypothetical protein
MIHRASFENLPSGRIPGSSNEKGATDYCPLPLLKFASSNWQIKLFCWRTTTASAATLTTTTSSAAGRATKSATAH